MRLDRETHARTRAAHTCPPPSPRRGEHHSTSANFRSLYTAQNFVDDARTACTQQGLRNGRRPSVRPSVRLSVCPVDRQQQRRAADLLPSAGICGRRAPAVDRYLLQQQMRVSK